MLDYTKLVDKDALLYVWQKIKSVFATKSELPTKVSQLTNDSGYKTTDTTYAEATASGAGLMSAADKAKLNGVANSADANVNADWTATTGDALILNKPTKVSTFINDKNYAVDAAYVHTDNNLTDALIQKINDAGSSSFDGTYDKLTGKPDLTQYQTATQVNTAISTAVSSAYKYKGSVANRATLPTSGQAVGDLYNLEDSGMNTAWNGTAWDDQAPTIDLSGYVQTADLGEVTNADIDTICV